MEVHVPRTGARPRRRERRVARHELALRCVELEDEDLVEALVGDDDEAAGAVEGLVVRVRARLLGPVRPGSARQRDQIGERSQGSVRSDGKDGHRARAVVRADQELVRRVHGDAHTVLAPGRLLAQHLQLAGGPVDRQRGDHLAVAVRRIEDALLLIQGQPRRIDEILDELHVRPDPRGPVHRVDVDALAAGVALLRGVAPDVDEHRASLALGSGARRRQRRAAAGHDRAHDAADEVPAPDRAGHHRPFPSTSAAAFSTTVPLKKSGLTSPQKRTAFANMKSRKSSSVSSPCSTSS